MGLFRSIFRFRADRRRRVLGGIFAKAGGGEARDKLGPERGDPAAPDVDTQYLNDSPRIEIGHVRRGGDVSVVAVRSEDRDALEGAADDATAVDGAVYGIADGTAEEITAALEDARGDAFGEDGTQTSLSYNDLGSWRGNGQLDDCRECDESGTNVHAADWVRSWSLPGRTKEMKCEAT